MGKSQRWMASRSAVTQRFSTWSWSGALEALRERQKKKSNRRASKTKKSSSSVLLREPPHQGETESWHQINLWCDSGKSNLCVNSASSSIHSEAEGQPSVTFKDEEGFFKANLTLLFLLVFYVQSQNDDLVHPSYDQR